MKKALIITALVLTAGSASALTQSDVTRYGLDASALTETQKLAIGQVINGGGTHSEIAPIVKSLANKG